MNIDRELQAALDVDPSPEFVARVRMRVASEPPPRRWGFSWVAVAVAAAAALVVAVVVTRSIGHQNASSELLASRTLPAVGVAVDPGSPKGLRYDEATTTAVGVVAAGVAQPSRAGVAAGVAQPSRAGVAAVVAQAFRPAHVAVAQPSRTGVAAVVAQAFRPAHVAVAQPFRAADVTAEILIDPREAAAFRRIVAGVGEGTVDLKPVLESGPFVAADLVPTADLQIAPLSIEPLLPSSEGARQ